MFFFTVFCLLIIKFEVQMAARSVCSTATKSELSNLELETVQNISHLNTLCLWGTGSPNHRACPNYRRVTVVPLGSWRTSSSWRQRCSWRTPLPHGTRSSPLIYILQGCNEGVYQNLLDVDKFWRYTSDMTDMANGASCVPLGLKLRNIDNVVTQSLRNHWAWKL